MGHSNVFSMVVRTVFLRFFVVIFLATTLCQVKADPQRNVPGPLRKVFQKIAEFPDEIRTIRSSRLPFLPNRRSLTQPFKSFIRIITPHYEYSWFEPNRLTLKLKTRKIKNPFKKIPPKPRLKLQGKFKNQQGKWPGIAVKTTTESTVRKTTESTTKK